MLRIDRTSRLTALGVEAGCVVVEDVASEADVNAPSADLALILAPDWARNLHFELPLAVAYRMRTRANEALNNNFRARISY